jgi:hypothetical protein
VIIRSVRITSGGPPLEGWGRDSSFVAQASRLRNAAETAALQIIAPPSLKPCRILLLLLLIPLLAGCKGYGLNEVPYTEDLTHWGQAVNGLQVGIARRNYNPGAEPTARQIYLIVRLKNATKDWMSILAPTAIQGAMTEPLAGDESVGVKLVYDSAAGVKTGEFRPRDKPVVQTMEPGKSYNLEIRLSPGKFGLDRFVAGTITAVYSNAQPAIKYDRQGGQAVSGLWTGEARSAPMILEVNAPATQEKR